MTSGFFGAVFSPPSFGSLDHAASLPIRGFDTKFERSILKTLRITV